MSTVANKGGLVKHLSVTRNSDSQSQTMLKTPFLSKSENYSVEVASFCVNKVPVISRVTEPAVVIRPWDTEFPAAEGELPIYYQYEDSHFTPKNCYSISEFVLQLQDFLHRFGFTFFHYGVETMRGFTQEEEKEILDEDERDEKPFFFTKTELRDGPGGVENRGWETIRRGSREEGGRIVTARVSPNGMLRVELSALFAANFYLEISPSRGCHSFCFCSRTTSRTHGIRTTWI